MKEPGQDAQASDRGTHELFQRLPTSTPANARDLEQAGFHKVQLMSFKHWHEIHTWCADKFGLNYTWTGSWFWFTTPEDATLFALTWCSS